ncbi:winged helix-turn-helix domain-containing protein [Enterobacter cloacae]|nr:winged helix-turn-helix domain-containing protein [Enterobacter cloacae]
MKIYILNEAIVFNPGERQITSINDSALMFSLSAASVRCLTALLDCRPEVLTKDQILESVWRKYGLVVTENSVHQAITSLRKIFKESGLEGDLILTQQRVGYHINPSVSVEVIVTSESLIPEKLNLDENSELHDANRTINLSKRCITRRGIFPKLNFNIALFLASVILWAVFLMSYSGRNHNTDFFSSPEHLVKYRLIEPKYGTHKIYVSTELLNNTEMIDLIYSELTTNENISFLLKSEKELSTIYINGTYSKNAMGFFFCNGAIESENTKCLSYVIVRG